LNEATVGGNIVMSLPAGPMISLASALEGICTLWPRSGTPHQMPVVEFVTGNHGNVLAPGELLRPIFLPASALRKSYAFRRSPHHRQHLTYYFAEQIRQELSA
jgi:CO/xanthine dehydrogenase FAD-binding subunit